MKNVFHSLLGISHVENILLENLSLFSQLEQFASHQDSVINADENLARVQCESKKDEKNLLLLWLALKFKSFILRFRVLRLFVLLIKRANRLANLIERMDNCVADLESHIVEKWDTLPEDQNQFLRELQVGLSDLQDTIHEERLLLQILLIFPSVARRKNLFPLYENVVYRLSGAISKAGRKRGLKQARNGEARYIGSFSEFIDS